MDKPIDQYRTLLLDNLFRPIKDIHWTRALTLDFQNKVIVVENYDRIVRSPSCEFHVPAVIALKQYLRFRPFRVRYSKRNVFARDNYTCQYCGCTPGVGNLTLDHVNPSSRGGRSVWENVVASCGPCNHQKGNRTPSEAGMSLLSQPGRPTPGGNTYSGRQTTPKEWREYLMAASG